MIRKFLDIITPRFVTERVVLTLDDSGAYKVVCLESEYEDFKYATGFGACELRGESRAFNLFGIAISPKVTLD